MEKYTGVTWRRDGDSGDNPGDTGTGRAPRPHGALPCRWIGSSRGQRGWGLESRRGRGGDVCSLGCSQEGTLQPEVKQDCFKSIKRKKENLGEKKRQRENTSLELHLFNYSLPGLSSKSAGSQEAKPHLFHYFNRHKTANETKSELKKKGLCSFHHPVLLLMSIVSLKYLYLQQIFKNQHAGCNMSD